MELRIYLKYEVMDELERKNKHFELRKRQWELGKEMAVWRAKLRAHQKEIDRLSKEVSNLYRKQNN